MKLIKRLTTRWAVCVAVAVLAVGMIGTPASAVTSSVTIAGSFQHSVGCGGDWQPDCATTHLTYDANDDIWQGVFNLAAGTTQYKAAINDSWDENYGDNGVFNGSNIYTTLAAGAPVKFYFDPKSHWATDSNRSRIVTAGGDFQADLGCAGDWDPSCMRSWLQDVDGDGTYAMTTTALPSDDYEVKAAINEGWTENYGAGGTFNGSNIAFSVPTDFMPVTFKFVSSTNVLSVTVGDETDPEVSDVSVGFFGGQINKVPYKLTWSASDNFSTDGSLVHKVQRRIRDGGSWGPWRAFATTTGVEQLDGSLPFWKTYQFRVRSRDEAGNWSDWSNSNVIGFVRRQERHFTLDPNWTITSAPDAMKDKVASSSTVDATATLHFYGVGGGVVFMTGPGMGKVQTCIDPSSYNICVTSDLDANPAVPRWTAAYFSNFPNGPHTFVVKVVSGTVQLDGAVIVTR